LTAQNNIESLSVEASTSHLAKVRDFVAEHAAKHGFNQKEISEIRLAVDEAYTNIIKHAYKNDPENLVTIYLGFDNDSFWISLQDKGESFDRASYKTPDLMTQIKQKKRGGMGVYLIHKLMDQVQYNRKGQFNEIRMEKYLQS